MFYEQINTFLENYNCCRKDIRFISLHAIYNLFHIWVILYFKFITSLLCIFIFLKSNYNILIFPLDMCSMYNKNR